MSRASGKFRGDKRRKEISRKKKQEMKRQRRLEKKQAAVEGGEPESAGTAEAEEPASE